VGLSNKQEAVTNEQYRNKINHRIAKEATTKPTGRGEKKEKRRRDHDCDRTAYLLEEE
jgi:hypothetical protein